MKRKAMEEQNVVISFVDNTHFNSPQPLLVRGSGSRGGLAEHICSILALSCSQTATLLEGRLKLGCWEQKFKHSKLRYSVGSILPQSLTTESSFYTYISFLHELFLYTQLGEVQRLLV